MFDWDVTLHPRTHWKKLSTLRWEMISRARDGAVGGNVIDPCIPRAELECVM